MDISASTAILYTTGRPLKRRPSPHAYIEKAYTKVETIPFNSLPISFQKALGGKDLINESDVYTRALPENPTWTDIFRNLDQLVGDSGDTHHRFLEGLKVEGETLFVFLGS